MSWATRFSAILFNGNIKELDTLPTTIKPYAVKSLILISKYLGNYPQFKAKLSNYGIKISKPDSMTAFLRILGASDSDIIGYYKQLQTILKPHQALFSKFLLYSGQRTSEAINSWNLIIKLNAEGKLNNLYNEELGCTMQFKYGKMFLRGKKNSFITFITPEFLQQIANSQELP